MIENLEITTLDVILFVVLVIGVGCAVALSVLIKETIEELKGGKKDEK